MSNKAEIRIYYDITNGRIRQILRYCKISSVVECKDCKFYNNCEKLYEKVSDSLKI